MGDYLIKRGRMSKVEQFEALKPYSRNERDEVLLDLLSQGMKHKDAAAAIGIHPRTVRKWLYAIRHAAALKGHSPEHDMTHTAPSSHVVKGVSTLYKGDEKVMQWVKTDLDKQAQLEALQHIIDAMKEEVTPTQEPKQPEVDFETDVIAFLNLGDGHVNMLAREYEVGHNFDLDTVERELCAAVSVMINQMPNYERIVVNDLGDFTHMENYVGETAAAENKLDHDGAFPAMVKVAVRIMRYIVNECLKKFKYVDVIINQGNHSRVNDIWTAELFRQLYEGSERVHILNNSNVFIPYRMGNTFVMVHHSDKCRPDRLASVMAADYAQDFGESLYRYVYVGHIHHKSIAKETNGVIVESFNTLAPADKYAHEHGYRSCSMLTAVLLSKTYGEVGRFTVPVKLVQDLVADAVGKERPSHRKEVYTV